jgi:hypothetical protein
MQVGAARAMPLPATNSIARADREPERLLLSLSLRVWEETPA